MQYEVLCSARISHSFDGETVSMLNIKIIYMHQSCDASLVIFRPPPPFNISFTKPTPYTLSFKVIECPEGSTFHTLLKKMPSLESTVLYVIRGNTAKYIRQYEGDFPLCDGDIIHITDHFSMAKRILEMVF